MALSIKNEELDSRIRRLAELTGKSLTTSLRIAVDNEIARHEQKKAKDFAALKAEVRQIQREVAKRALPNPPTDDEILGYDEHGLPS